MGNQYAFETLVQRYSAMLFNFIHHFMGDHDLACDILQQVFLQLFVSLSTLHTDKQNGISTSSRLKNEVLKLRSRSNIVIAPASTGSASRRRIAVIKIDHTNRGR